MLTAAEVAAQLGLSGRKVYELHARGLLPGYRFGRAVRFDPADVEGYKASLKPAPQVRQRDDGAMLRFERFLLNAIEADKIAGTDSGSAEYLALIQGEIEASRQRHAASVRVKKTHHAGRRRSGRRVPSWANLDAIRAVYAEAKRLTTETGVPHHVDHIVPLLGKLVSGLHVENNLQVLTQAENARKKNRFEP